ncbi:hypothetical protein FXN61_15525 [Lentzea sp. PSKA42]|uniref:Uncharacterized protein n=1 Tax=Lentzea indica TaxID=2604800 RepID=A0ABX1FGR2_9PSEU|nr:hypothetical protein [Lentzea indica]NKE58158.1 hypothetical protein [Lentzea indica]
MAAQHRTGMIAAAVVTFLALGGCSSSPKEELIESADEKCRVIGERFAGDLAFGESVGKDDEDKLRQRIMLVKDLATHVRGLPAPESGKDKLDDWLGRLDKYAGELQEFETSYRNARRGQDLVLAMQLAIVKEAADAVGPPAKDFGFGACAQVESWVPFPK